MKAAMSTSVSERFGASPPAGLVSKANRRIAPRGLTLIRRLRHLRQARRTFFGAARAAVMTGSGSDIG